MNQFAQRILAATPKQLDLATGVVSTVFGQWDKQKDLGGGQGTLIWKATNPQVKKLGVKGMVTLTYKDRMLTLAIGDEFAQGFSWVYIRKALRNMKTPAAKALLKIRNPHGR